MQQRSDSAAATAAAAATVYRTVVVQVTPAGLFHTVTRLLYGIAGSSILACVHRIPTVYAISPTAMHFPSGAD